MQRKPPKKVRSITGGRNEEDVIDDFDMEIIADLQAEEWRVQRKLQRAVAVLEYRILHGATMRAKQYYFDKDLGMVRSRKEKAGNE